MDALAAGFRQPSASTAMLATGLRETLKVAREVSTDLGQTLLGFASEVEEVGNWTIEAGKREAVKAKREAVKAVQAVVPPSDAPRQKQGAVRRDGGGLQASLRNRGGVMLDEQGSAASSSSAMPSLLEEVPGTAEEVSFEGEAVASSGVVGTTQEAERETVESPRKAEVLTEAVESPQAEVLTEAVESPQVPSPPANDLVEAQKLQESEAAAIRWAQAVKKARQLREQEEAEQQLREVFVRTQSLLQQQQEELLLRSSGSEEDEAVGTLSPVENEEGLVLAKVNPEGKYYPLEQLTENKVWRNLDLNPTAREFFLSDDDFRSLFEIDREAYARLPKWKRVALKKKHSLF